MTLPVLHTDRLVLVPVADQHRDELIALNADPEVMRFILGRAATPAETQAEWEQRLLRQSDQVRGLGYWAGSVDGAFVGWWSASAFADDPTVSGVGYRLVRSAWGRGLATEGARAMLDRAFACPDVERVVASTMAVNAASRAVLTRLGMVQVDTWVTDWDEPIPGWEQGEVLYEMRRADRRVRRTSSSPCGHSS